MAHQSDWTIEFYRLEEGTSPVEDFLRGLDDKTQAGFIWSIEQLRLHNVHTGEPLVKHLEARVYPNSRRKKEGKVS